MTEMTEKMKECTVGAVLSRCELFHIVTLICSNIVESKITFII